MDRPIWEYHGLWYDPNYGLVYIEKNLNELGADGWELVCHIHTNDGHVFILKRMLPELNIDKKHKSLYDAPNHL